MRKFISIVLALTMVMAMGTTAFAAENSGKADKDNNSVNIPVKGVYEAMRKSPDIVSVDVEWNSMNFIYAKAQQGTWNPEKHEFTNATEDKGWVKDTSDITVTNHSNVNITATFAWAQDGTYNDSNITGRFLQAQAQAEAADDEGSESSPTLVALPDNKISLDAGEEGEPKNADKETVTFQIGGELTSTTEDNTLLGTITVSINKDAASGDNGNSEETLTGLSLYFEAENCTYIYYVMAEHTQASFDSATFIAEYSGNSGTTYKRISGNDENITITPKDPEVTVETLLTGADGDTASYTATYFGHSVDFDVTAHSGFYLPRGAWEQCLSTR